jgi:hypothetical protein
MEVAMPDLRQFANTLSRIMPFLAQEKMQRENIRRWLESNMQELAAREASQGRLQTQEASDAASRILLGMLGKFYENKLGGPEMAPGAFKATVPGLTGGIEELPGAAAKLEEAKNAFTDMTTQFQANQEITPQVTRVLSTQLPPNEILDMYKAAKLAGLTRGGQVLTERGYNLEERGLGYRGQELEQKKAELEQRKVEAKGGGAKDAAAVIKEAWNDLEASLKQVAGVGGFYGPAGLDPETKQGLRASIRNAQRKIDTASKAVGIESPIKTGEQMRVARDKILSDYAAGPESYNWYYLLFLGYDPDFVFNLQKQVEKPDKKSKGSRVEDEAMMKRAMALIEAMRGGKVD